MKLTQSLTIDNRKYYLVEIDKILGILQTIIQSFK